MSSYEYKPFQLRDKANFLKYVKIELAIVKKEWKVLLPCVIMQYAHAIFHNLAYWIQAHKLSFTQRITLYDAGFELMGELTGTASHISEYLVFGAVFAPSILLVCSVAIFRQNPRQPRYIAIILKRVLLHISIALIFRICSFLITTLPAPAMHCRLVFNETCLSQYPEDPVRCASENPDFDPPTTAEFFTNLDALEGCGDLMFSSHTIYTLSFILTVSKYWWNKYLFAIMISMQVAIAFLIVASRKHYSLDVFSALYIVPLLWFTQEAYLKDINNKDVQINAKTIHEYYEVDISPDIEVQPVSVNTDSDRTEPYAVTLPITPDAKEEPSSAPFERKNSI